jgi:hypothetical protein
MWPIPLQPGIGHPVGPGIRSVGATITNQTQVIISGYILSIQVNIFQSINLHNALKKVILSKTCGDVVVWLLFSRFMAIVLTLITHLVGQ